MIFEKIFTFILFLGPLVFFHELGHFFFARLFKVRVEVFSLGFGPKLLRYKKGETEYVISLIPLGGYVKMFGDDPFNKEAIPADEQKFSYNHQGKWARFWIVLGGPLTNFILAFFIFYSLLLVGEKIPEIKLGAVDSKSVLYSAGIRSGDVLLKLDGNEIYNPSDLVTDGKGLHKKLEVKRHGNIVALDINLKGEAFFEEIIKHPPILREPYIVNHLGKIYGLSLSPKTVDLNLSIEELIEVKPAPEKLYAYPIKGDQDIANNENVIFDFNDELILNIKFDDAKTFALELSKNNFWTLDLMVKSMNFNSPAEKGGVKARDIFFKINGTSVASFEELRDYLQKTTSPKVNIEAWRNGELVKFELTPDLQEVDGKKMKLLGIYSFIELQKIQFIKTKSKGVFGSFYYGAIRTWDSFVKTFDGFVKIITNQVSFKQVGGVFTIGKVANDSFKISFTYFLQLMALISVNLGIINLFPILPLDGGHITFIFLEIINGGPVSRRKMEIAQQIGLSLLLMLMVGSIFNDVTRFF